MQKLKAGKYVPILITAVLCILLLGIFISRKAAPYITEYHDTQETTIPSGIWDTFQKININTATADELAALEGIGEVLSQRIVDYRNAHGAFKQIEDIKNVSGIGDIRFKQIEDFITVGGTP